MAFDIQRQKALDVTLEGTKQLIALATAVIAFTITFKKDFIGTSTPAGRVLAVVGWLFYFLSILGGIAAIFALAGQLEPGNDSGDGTSPTPSIWAGPVKCFMIFQQICFLFGVLLTALYGAIALY